jgi:putative restriction endonuclease
MPEYIFGNIPNVTEGDIFPNRRALREAGIHLTLVAGIDGNPAVGASSIVLNGGYIDDLDLGDEIVYTGHGGNDSNTKRQIADQSWDAPGNRALIRSEISGLPVRVTRGYEHVSQFSPTSGYQYGGLYQVIDHFGDNGRDSFFICRYRLRKIESSLPANQFFGLPKGNEVVNRNKTTTLRIVRDTELARAIKALYDYTCQICGVRISVRNIPYAEAAHIKPLGRPHNGTDTPGNILCLCPNHHVMFDKGAFSINENRSLVGADGKLFVHKNHDLDEGNLKYHLKHVYING